VLARLDSDAARTAVLRGTRPVLSQPSWAVGQFVAALSSAAQRGAAGSITPSGARSPDRTPGRTG
jgi:hypothetical protein